MTLVSGILIDSSGVPVPGAVLTLAPPRRAAFSRPSGVQVPEQITVTADASGEVSFTALPGLLVGKVTSGLHSWGIELRVPDAPTASLEDCVEAGGGEMPPASVTLAQAARDGAVAALAETTAARDVAVAAAATAATDAVAAAATAATEAVAVASVAIAEDVAEAEASRIAAQAARIGAEAAASTAATTAANAAATGVLAATAANATAADTARIAAQAAAADAQSLQSSLAVSPIGGRLSDPRMWTFERASTRIGFDEAGNFEELPADQAQVICDRTGTLLGVAFGKARTNRLMNPNCLGAAGGVMAGGGTSPPLPTGWAMPTRNTGTTVTVTPATLLGRPGLSFRFSAASALATPTADTIEFGTRDDVVCAAGEAFVSSFWYRLAAGSLPAGTSLRARLVTRDAGNGVVQGVGQPLTLDGTWRQASHPIVVGAGGVEIMSGFQLFLVAGVTPDVTIEIVAPGLAIGTVGIPSPAMPPIGAAGPFTRAADRVTVSADKLGMTLNESRGALFVTLAGYAPETAGDWSGIVSLGDGTEAEVLGLAVNASWTSVEARLTSGGVANAASAVAMTPPGGPIRMGLSWGDGFIQAFARGVAGPKIALTRPMPAITQAMLGRLGSLSLEAAIAGVDLRTAPYFDAAGAAITLGV